MNMGTGPTWQALILCISMNLETKGSNGRNREVRQGARDGFFISGALVVTANRTLADNNVNQMCRMTGKNARQNLHWRRLKPDQKEIYSKMISESKNLRGINICIYKPGLDPKIFLAERLYFYFTRHLLERAS